MSSDHPIAWSGSRPGAGREAPQAAEHGPIDDVWQWRDEVMPPPVGEPRFLETIEPALLALRESGAALRGLLRRRSSTALAPRRLRLLLVGGAVVVAAAVAGCLLVPTSSSTPAVAASATPSAPSTIPAADDAVVRGDDPVRAAEALLVRRQECLRRSNAACLAEVDQWGGPAMLDDRESLRAGNPNAAGDPAAGLGHLALIDQIGATALLSGQRARLDDTAVDEGSRSTAGGGSDGESLSAGGETAKPVSLLVVKGETGWRIRSIRVGGATG